MLKSFFWIVCFYLSSYANFDTTDYILKGNHYYLKQQFKQAIFAYQKAIAVEQNIIFAWHNLANSYTQIKQYGLAIAAHKRAIEIFPSFVASWRNLANIYYQLGVYPEAIVAYNSALKLDSTNPEIFQWQGESFLKVGAITEAIRSFENSLNASTNPLNVYYALSEAYLQLEDYSSAQEVIKEAIFISDNPHIYFYLGYLYELSEDFKQAIDFYEQGLSLDSTKKSFYFRVAYLYEQQHHSFLSLITLDQAIKVFPLDSRLYYEKGLILLNQSRLEIALTYFQKSYELGFSLAKVGIENISFIYWNQGQKEKSKQVLLLLR